MNSETTEVKSQNVLEVKNLKVYFPIREGILGKVTGHVKAVDDVSFEVKRGEVFALVGESGCGKTTTAKAVLGLEHITAGEVRLLVGRWKDKPVSWNTISSSKRRELRRHVQIVFQDPFSSLDPRMSVRQIVKEPLGIHKIADSENRLSELMAQVGLSESLLGRYPHEFSGGQRQRIGIARALATRPEMIIADEPVSALDVSIQAQIINLLDDLKNQYNQSLLFISHDLAVVRHMANRMAVMYLGKIMELGTNEQIYSSPSHPYTHTLLDSVPVPGRGRAVRRARLPEEKKDEKSSGCPFYPRCPMGESKCLENTVELRDIGQGHLVACIKA